MTFQFGKNPEYTIYTFYNLRYWALLFEISGWIYNGCNRHSDSKCYSFNISFLCFGINLEIWKWNE